MTTNPQRYPQRVRNELRFRELTVLRVERPGVGFQRVVLGGEQLEGFLPADLTITPKFFFPQPGTSFVPPVVTDEGIVWGDGPRPATRDYTPLYDAERHELLLDFYIHDGGVASQWALNAQVGDKLTIGGPRGSLVVPEDYAPGSLYVCDESGMPALRRRPEGISQLAVRPNVMAVVTINDVAYQDYPRAHLRGFDIQWVIGHNPQAVADKLAALTVPAEGYFIWLTGGGRGGEIADEPL